MSSENTKMNILMGLGGIYLIISQIMAVYFWWLYAQSHGFWSSLLIGPFVGELKGALWIFHIW